MELKEAIDGLRYMISGGCTDSHWDFIDEIELAIETMETQIPKAAAYDSLINEWYCTSCGFPVSDVHENGFSDSYCWHCGQAIDWGD